MVAVMALIFIIIPNLHILQLLLLSNHTKPHCTEGSPGGAVTRPQAPVQELRSAIQQELPLSPGA